MSNAKIILMHFNFGTMTFLLLLFLLPCFILCKEKSRQYYFPKYQWLTKQTFLFSWQVWLKILLFSLMVFALAKPFVYDAKNNGYKKGRDLILALDASGSMAQSGFNSKARFQNKYESAIALASDFIQKRFDDNMGLVIFGSFAYTASPLTYDLPSLTMLLEMTNVGIAGESTAIGDAIIQALRSLSFGKAKNKAIILITDGYHNAGSTSPKEAVRQAKVKHVKIYTIGLGKKSNYDYSLLQTLAKETGGFSYAATTATQLRQIYQEIDRLEPSKIRSDHYSNPRLLISFPLVLVFLLLLIWTLLSQRTNI